jgi:uncharacterized integral membrane protein (TIGR00697 family)
MSFNHLHPKKSEQKLLILTGIYVFCILLAEIFGIKTIPLGLGNIHLGPIFIRELKVSVAIFLLPLIFSINDIIIEVYGKKMAKTVYRIGLGCIVGLIGFSLLATWLPSSQLFSGSEAAYNQIFHQTTRIALASIIAFALSDFLDIVIFARLREKIKNLGIRSNLSNILSQFIDTTTFVYLAFFTATFGHAMIWGIILPYWIFKCCMSVITTPFVYL